jgi:hypothetical protein
MRTFISALILLIGCNTGIAQKNYLPGILSLSNGDTLRGYINYLNWEKNPRKISFKANNESVSREFDANQLKYVEIPGKDIYQTEIVWKDMRPVRLKDLLPSNVLQQVKDTVLMRLLVRGDRISLFELIDEKPHYYIQEPGDTLQELQYKLILNDDNSVTTRNIFRDHMKKYALNKGPKNLERKIENASYNDEDLASIVSLINERVEYPAAGNDNLAIKKTRFFTGGGVSFNNNSFSGSKKELNLLSPSSRPGFTIVAGADILPKRGGQKFFVRTELKYISSSYKSSGRSKDFYGDEELREYQFKMSSINLSISGMYNVVRMQQGKIYAGAGGGYYLTSYRDHIYQTTNLATGEVKSEKNYLAFEKGWGDVFLRTGWMYRDHWELGLLYRVSGNFTTFSQISLKNKSTIATLLYHF